DVGSQLMLNVHGNFGGEPVTVPIDVGGEPDAVVVYVCQTFFARGHGVVGTDFALGLGAGHINDLFESRTQGHDLETTGISEGRAAPVHEFAQPTVFIEQLGSGLQIQVMGVGEHGLSAQLFDHFGQHRFDGGFRTDWNICRCLNITVRRMNGSGTAVCAFKTCAKGERKIAGFCHELQSSLPERPLARKLPDRNARVSQLFWVHRDAAGDHTSSRTDDHLLVKGCRTDQLIVIDNKNCVVAAVYEVFMSLGDDSSYGLG